MLKIKQVKSRIGRSKKQRETLKKLGLKKINDVVNQPDNEAIRGMINKVAHLVEVEEINGD